MRDKIDYDGYITFETHEFLLKMIQLVTGEKS